MAAADARLSLLAGLIDHAPTFPPASLEPEAALAEDRRARASAERELLGRLVWPASRLDALGAEERLLSVVLDDGAVEDGRVEAVELRRPASLDGLGDAAREVFVELPLDAALEEDLDALAERGLGAKVRCGGASVPSIAELASFLRGCRERGLAFKATAGLHHAVRGQREHGFLNVLAAVVFGDEEEALAERDAHAFALTADGFAWRDRHAGAAELAQARRERLRSIGSCSFFEPVEELRALGMLPA